MLRRTNQPRREDKRKRHQRAQTRQDARGSPCQVHRVQAIDESRNLPLYLRRFWPAGLLTTKRYVGWLPAACYTAYMHCLYFICMANSPCLSMHCTGLGHHRATQSQMEQVCQSRCGIDDKAERAASAVDLISTTRQSKRIVCSYKST